MRGLDIRPRTRVKGRPAIERSLRGLLIRVHRFGTLRAGTADQIWAGRVIELLRRALEDSGINESEGVKL